MTRNLAPKNSVRWLVALACLMAMAALALGLAPRVLERRHALTQTVPESAALIGPDKIPMTLPAMMLELDAPVRMLAGAKSEYRLTLLVGETQAADAPNGIDAWLETVWLLTDASYQARPTLEPLTPNGTVSDRVEFRSGADSSEIRGELILRERFYDDKTGAEGARDLSEDALDSWVRVAKPLRIELVRPMGFNAAQLRTGAWTCATAGCVFAVAALMMEWMRRRAYQ